MTLKSEDAVAIASTAQRLGVDPRTLGALFELESGTDPNIWGGAGGQYRGLIQFGPGARKEVGLPSGPMTISEQLPYVEKYFQQRGFQPGRHGPTELYRTVLVGNPGQSGTDSFGTNSDSAAKRMMPGGDLYQRFSSKFNSALGDSAAAVRQIPTTTGLADTTMPVKRAADPLIAAVGAMVGQGLNASGVPTTRKAMSEQAQEAVIKALFPGQDQVNSGGGAVANAATSVAGPDGELDIVSLGKRLQGLGLKVAENPAFGGVGKHSPNSHHDAGNALDLTIQPGSPLLRGRPDSDWRALTQQIGAELKAALPGAEIFHPGDDPVGGHDSHIHLALPNGRTKLTAGLAQLLSRA